MVEENVRKSSNFFVIMARTSCGPFVYTIDLEILANGKASPLLPTSKEPLLNVEPLNDARTMQADFFSILLDASLEFIPSA